MKEDCGKFVDFVVERRIGPMFISGSVYKRDLVWSRLASIKKEIVQLLFTI